MKKSFLLLVAIAGLLLTLNQSLAAQEEGVARKVFYTELGGPGVIMSANFDSRFAPNERLGFGYRLGVGFGIRESYDYLSHYVSQTYYSFPLGLNYVFGKPNSAHTFEVGGGLTFLSRNVALYYYGNNNNPGYMIGAFTFMYRLMPENGGFSLRAGLTPIIGTGGDLYPMGAVSIGYAF